MINADDNYNFTQVIFKNIDGSDTSSSGKLNIITLSVPTTPAES